MDDVYSRLTEEEMLYMKALYTSFAVYHPSKN